MAAVTGWAEFSGDRRFRWALGRDWGGGPALGWLMLNPSTAGAETGDRTVDQVVHFSRREGYGGAWIANLYGYRSPLPRVLRDLAVSGAGYAAGGPENDRWIRTMLAAVPRVVLAWGATAGQPWARDRRDAVLAMVAASGTPALCLGTTSGGHPRHPCRLPRSVPLVPWPPGLWYRS